jgi:hypothetical protein
MGTTKPANPGLAFELKHVLLPLFFGCAVVALPVGPNAVAFTGWVVFLLITTRVPRESKGASRHWPPPDRVDEDDRRKIVAQQPRRFWRAIATQTGIMILVIVIAGLLPVKDRDRRLNGTISVPRTEMTLVELKDWIPSTQLPMQVYLGLEPVDETLRVRFPQNSMAMAQFIQTIEDQTPLRRHFSGCGNSTTLLWGPVYGVYFWRPPPPPPGAAVLTAEPEPAAEPHRAK